MAELGQSQAALLKDIEESQVALISDSLDAMEAWKILLTMESDFRTYSRVQCCALSFLVSYVLYDL